MDQKGVSGVPALLFAVFQSAQEAQRGVPGFVLLFLLTQLVVAMAVPMLILVIECGYSIYNGKPVVVVRPESPAVKFSANRACDASEDSWSICTFVRYFLLHHFERVEVVVQVVERASDQDLVDWCMVSV